MPQEAPGNPRRPPEATGNPGRAPGSSRRLQESPGDSGRFQEASGNFRKPQEASGGPRRPQEAPGGSRRLQEAPGSPRKLQEPRGEASRGPSRVPGDTKHGGQKFVGKAGPLELAVSTIPGNVHKSEVAPRSVKLLSLCLVSLHGGQKFCFGSLLPSSLLFPVWDVLISVQMGAVIFVVKACRKLLPRDHN